ncbi:MAG: DUF2974 domain-containing protein [Hominenteromicrobium sp.]
MANIIDYVEQEFHTMQERPFSEVDSLVLSQLSYINLGAVLHRFPDTEKAEIRDLLRAEDFDGLFHDVRDIESNRRLLIALAASPRFRSIRIGNLTEKLSNQLEEQFAAVTVYPDDEHACLVFRGTDATLIGWKEDFNMAFLPAVPSQADAVAYLNRIGAAFPGDITVCGHSKGGNLAIYAAMFCEDSIQARIRKIYSHDGPGFNSGVLERDEYRNIADRVCKTLPQSSLIGMLLENHGTYTVVESSQIGIMQHDPFSWLVTGGEFHAVERISAGAQYMNKTLNSWISGMSMEERERFVDALYTILAAGNITNVFEFGDDFQKKIGAMYNAAVNLDPETRSFVLQVIRQLASLALKNLPRPANPKKT